MRRRARGPAISPPLAWRWSSAGSSFRSCASSPSTAAREISSSARTSRRSAFGVERLRLSAAGFGDTRRFAYNTSAEGQQENRRVNIILDFHKQ